VNHASYDHVGSMCSTASLHTNYIQKAQSPVSPHRLEFAHGDPQTVCVSHAALHLSPTLLENPYWERNRKHTSKVNMETDAALYVVHVVQGAAHTARSMPLYGACKLHDLGVSRVSRGLRSQFFCCAALNRWCAMTMSANGIAPSSPPPPAPCPAASTAVAASPSRVIRLAIYFNPKKRTQFLRPLFTQTHYTLDDPCTGEQVCVEIVVIESDEQLRSEVRHKRRARHGTVSRPDRAAADPTCNSSRLCCLVSPLQPSLDIILLKLTDLMTCSLYSLDPLAQLAASRSLALVRSSIAEHGARRPLTVVESFERVEAVLNRAKIQTIVQRMNMHCSEAGSRCTIPNAFLYQQPAATAGVEVAATHDDAADATSSIADMNVLHALPSSMVYPVICKSVAACGTAASHRMYVLQRAEDFQLMHQHAANQQTASNSTSIPVDAASPSDSPLAQLPSSAPPPPIWLVQQYVNHSAVIYKVYVLDDEVHVVAKVSGRCARCDAMRRERAWELWRTKLTHGPSCACAVSSPHFLICCHPHRRTI
jgi:hypothetical protein